MPGWWTTLVAAGHYLPRWIVWVVVMVLCSGNLTDAGPHGEARLGPPRHVAGAQMAVPAADTRSAAVGRPAAGAQTFQDLAGSGTSSGRGGFLGLVVTHRIVARSALLPLSGPRSTTRNMGSDAGKAFERAFAAARRAGLSPRIRSAWRSERRQQILFDRAIAKYGSRKKAMRRVLPPNKSAHVKGYAADVEPRSAAKWLERHGARYGLCRRYDNEWWHFEYLGTSDCPARLSTPAG